MEMKFLREYSCKEEIIPRLLLFTSSPADYITKRLLLATRLNCSKCKCPFLQVCF